MDAPDIKHREIDHEDTARGSGGIRPAILIIAPIAVCLYLIKPILLPFVVAGIVAYVCTPLLHWLAAKTKLPRPLLAALLFLLLVGIACGMGFVAGQRL